MLPDALFWDVHMYGIMIAVGILCCFGVLFKYGKKRGLDPRFLDFCFYDGIGAIAFGFLSAAFFQGLYNFIEDPSGGFSLKGGITFIGGLIGGIVFFIAGYLIFRKKLKNTLADLAPVAACCITVAHAFGRVGCFFAGCCYGKETDGPLGVKFPYLSHKVYPTQLYEAIFLFIIFGVLSWFVWNKKAKNAFPVYLIAYGVFRFLLEFLRGDDRGKLFGVLSPSQFWSIVLVAAGLIVIFVWPKIRDKFFPPKPVAARESAEAGASDPEE
ncbi:MAG: prolipoprotein diacylglyceryl transferase [Candidatus Borkfalkiaceae bacterium]|nr:prolipoprotein diacylglyceryl transferase [Christensenellaceae bacterium]